MTRQLFSVLVPLVSLFGGPYLSTWLGPGAPPIARYALSAFIGAIAGGFGSEFTAFPMHLDAGIEAGITMAMGGQKLLMMKG